jgi:hypothetical protein
VTIRKELAMLSAEPKANKTQLKALLEELRKIDA